MNFQKFKDRLFWKTQFDEIWNRELRYDSKAHKIFTFDEIEKQKYFWREKRGQQFKYSPRLAAYKAFKELADKWYRNNEYHDENALLEVAYILEGLFPYIDEDGNYQDAKKSLDEPWKNFAKKFWENWEAEQKKEKTFENELQSYRFEMAEIDKAWETLKSGNIPKVAYKIWEASYPRKWAQEIISDANVSIYDFVFWMCVFKAYLGYREEIVMEKHMYVGTKEKLQDVISSKIKNIAI
tara:strand:- start:39 stop:755 length:717 start_codon:yes stop_codon:yes gene_type:complete